MILPPDDSPPCVLLDWDTNFFGIRIGRVQGSVLRKDSLGEIFEWSAKNRIDCLYFGADGSSPETLDAAFRGGFRFVDVRLAMVLKAENVVESVHSPLVREGRRKDMESVFALAGKTFRDTRFFKDQGFGREKARELYCQWIRRDFASGKVFVSVSAKNPEVLNGFISCHFDGQTRDGNIGLVAVDDESQGEGVSLPLIGRGLAWLKSTSCQGIHVATQASNVPAQNLYQKFGFRSSQSTVWFHRWFDHGRLAP